MTATDTTPTAPGPSQHVHRVEVRCRPGHHDPAGAAVLEQARPLGVRAVRTARVFLIEAPFDDLTLRRIAEQLLADPVNQQFTIGAAPAPHDGASVEVHFLPGVMDPVAQSTRDAVIEMLDDLSPDQVEVRTGVRYDLIGASVDDDARRRFAHAALANPVIHAIHLTPFRPQRFPTGTTVPFELVHVPIRQLDDDALDTLSSDGHLFLNVQEMRAIQDHFRRLGREPTDAELETIAQTWSEHCVHKTLKSTINYRHEDRAPGPGPAPGPDPAPGPGPGPDQWSKRPGHSASEDGTVTIQNLLKSTIAAATREWMSRDPSGFCISVFEDNAGIVRFDDQDGVCIKVETHNHPSAIEPYGGAATGAGGCIRDVLGTGLAARPVANTDVFCVAWEPDASGEGPKLPRGVLSPRRTLHQVVAGVRDYGNRMGIPTVNGAVWFHDDFVANPLVFCGCIGLIPLDKCFGSAQPGDRIIALGGRTGRDGIHGATFSSAQLTDTHAETFSHAVQIGNAIAQKKMMDVILQARDWHEGCLFHAITDCGAGGFSSAVGEMGIRVGAEVTLEAAPLKYQGLRYTEIWISEAQERMVLAVPPDKTKRLEQLCTDEDVEFCDLGRFGANGDDGAPHLVLTYHGHRVAQLSMDFLHEGIPTPVRQARWRQAKRTVTAAAPARTRAPDLESTLKLLLAHPNIASKQWIVRQYDHEVQGGSVVKPLVGPHQDGPSDAAVLRPKLTSDAGIALGCGLQPGLSEKATGKTATCGDSYWATLAAIDEAVRNVVCVGADPKRIAILDNFCWPNCDDPDQLGSLVRAAEACYDGAMAYGTPFVSGKDSLSNQFTTEEGLLITIPPTLLITALGIVPQVRRCRTMNAKAPGNALLLVGPTTAALGGSHYVVVTADASRDLSVPQTDLEVGPRTAAAVAHLIGAGQVQSAHDCSDGGLLVAAAEMAFAGRVGLELELAHVPDCAPLDVVAACFAETPGRYLLEIEPARVDAVTSLLRGRDVPVGRVGTFARHQRLVLAAEGLDAPLDDLRSAWLGTLDW